jgi:hypothetical protein
MIDINSVYKTVQDLLRKNQQGYLTPSEFNRYANIANKFRFNELYGPTQQERNGKPIREGYGQNQQIDEKLSVFLIKATISIDGAGHLVKPNNFLRLDSVQKTDVKTFKWTTRDKEGSYINSAVLPPTAQYVVYADYGTYYRFTPNSLGSADVTYLSKPADVVWAYTLDVNNRPIYNSGGSTHFQWEDNEVGNIIAKILEYAGKAVADGSAVQLAAQLDAKGQ